MNLHDSSFKISNAYFKRAKDQGSLIPFAEGGKMIYKCLEPPGVWLVDRDKLFYDAETEEPSKQSLVILRTKEIEERNEIPKIPKSKCVK